MWAQKSFKASFGYLGIIPRRTVASLIYILAVPRPELSNRTAPQSEYAARNLQSIGAGEPTAAHAYRYEIGYDLVWNLLHFLILNAQ
jgi:hypothetical protein